MKIKRFSLPTFEEWEACNKDIRKNLGAYRVEIRAVSWGEYGTRYQFALALSNCNACNIFTDKEFSKTIMTKDKNELKQWYNNTLIEFNSFWEELILTTYFD